MPCKLERNTWFLGQSWVLITTVGYVGSFTGIVLIIYIHIKPLLEVRVPIDAASVSPPPGGGEFSSVRCKARREPSLT